jgi:cytidylate kinase
VFLSDEDVSEEIRLPEMSMYASAVSALGKVRAFLLQMQRDFAKTNNVIMDGRDIGTVVLPDADVKIFMYASSEARAERRYKELIEKGKDVTYEDVLSDMIERDKNDSSRALAPCVPAEDAIMLDNSEMSLEVNIEKVLEIINEKINVAV